MVRVCRGICNYPGTAHAYPAALELASIKAPAVIEQFITVSCECVPVCMVELIFIEKIDLYDPFLHQLIY
jgi:hypothetical protein